MRPSLKRHVLVLLREVLGLTQKDFADYVGCAESTLQAVERGPDRLKLSEGLAEKIFVATGVDPEWLQANNFNKPMVAHWKGAPYTKELFEAIQGRKHLPPEWSQELQDTAILKACGKLFATLNAAHTTSNESSIVVYRRICDFADRLAREFGVNPDAFDGETNWTRGIDLVEQKVNEFRKRDAPLWPPTKPIKKGRKKSLK